MLRGDLAGLGKNASLRKAWLDAALRDGERLTSEQLSRLREAAGRNAVLLAAAMEGLRDAGEEIGRRAADHRRIGYGPGGDVTRLSAGPGRERRA